MRMTRRMSAAALMALAAAGCGDSQRATLTSPDGAKPRLTTAAYVSVCCATTKYPGVQYQVYADVRDINNNTISNPVVHWTTSNNGVASIAGSTTTGIVQTVGVGTTTLYANVDGVIGSTTLTVQATPAVTTVQIVNAPLNLQMGHPSGVTARAYDQYGTLMSGVSFTYSIQNTGIATVSSGGALTPASPGTTTLTVTASGVSATAQVNVIPQISLSLSGPSTIWSSGQYQWSVQASGGTGSYTYQWYVDYAYGSYSQALSTSSSTSLWVDENTGPFVMRVVVTSGGVSSEAGTMVCNFIAGANC